MLRFIVLGFGLMGLLLWATPAMAQPSTDEQLAAHYFQNGEFDKAALYYQKLYDRSPTDLYYQYYLKSLYELEDLKGVQKLIKRQIKTYPDNGVYLVDYGNLYTLQEEESKAKQQYEKAIKNLHPNRTSVTLLARAFLSAGHPNYALRTYEEAERKSRGSQVFNFEKAEVYGEMGNYDSMIEEYLNMLSINENYLQSIQNVLNRNLAFDNGSPQSTALKEQLLRKIQKNPGQPVFAEMLIWLYLQQKNYTGALIQAKALDRRMNEGGRRLMSLAQMTESIGNYDVAIKSYEYVMERGPRGPYYVEASISRLRALKEKITTTSRYTEEDLNKLETSYYTSLEELGRTPNTVSLLKDLAHLEAYFLNKPDTAVAILFDAIQIPRIRPNDLAECKLELGDILVAQGEIWDASLYYSQVEKAYKYDRIGEQAKFRNARISYYTGDFGWAKAQLDVLKGSTSKLIANDALDLSLLITDNTGWDSTDVMLKMFARADLLFFQNKSARSLEILDSLDALYPSHPITDEVLFQRYKISMKKRNYEEALTYLEKIYTAFGQEILGDDAVFLTAQLYQYYLEDAPKAMEWYEKVLLEYSASLYVVEARKQFRYLRGDTLVPGGEPAKP